MSHEFDPHWVLSTWSLVFFISSQPLSLSLLHLSFSASFSLFKRPCFLPFFTIALLSLRPFLSFFLSFFLSHSVSFFLFKCPCFLPFFTIALLSLSLYRSLSPSFSLLLSFFHTQFLSSSLNVHVFFTSLFSFLFLFTTNSSTFFFVHSTSFSLFESLFSSSLSVCLSLSLFPPFFLTFSPRINPLTGVLQR